MAMRAIAYAKAHARRRMMACTTSIGPGARTWSPRRGRPRQPPARAAPARRRVRQPHPGPGPPAGRGLRGPDDLRQRLLPARFAILGPNHAPRAAAPEPPRRHLRPDGPGDLRPGDARAASGRAGGGVRLPRALPRAARAPAPAPRGRSRPAHRGAERLGEPNVRSSLPGAAFTIPWPSRRCVLAERHGIPVSETQAGKGSLPWDHAARRASASADRPPPTAGRRRRSRPRRRDPPGRFPTGSCALFQAGLTGGVERGAPRCREARRGLWWATRAAASRAVGGPRRRRAPAGWMETARRLTENGRAWSMPPPPADPMSPQPRGRSWCEPRGRTAT